MSDEKARLRRLLDLLPLDSPARNAAAEGIEKLSDAAAKELADDMAETLEELPSVLDSLEEHLRDAEKSALS